MTDLAARMLGRVQVHVDGRPVAICGRQAQALVALLALRPRRRTREAVAADLWPDADPGSSGALRQALWIVRSSIVAAGVDPDLVLEADQESIGLRPDLHVEHDVAEFERLVRGRPARPEEAIDVYRGELLEGLSHECFARDRERLADAYEDALALVAGVRWDRGDPGGARDAALDLLARDPLREEAHEILINVYGACGSRSQVVRQFRRLERLLEAELGEAPLPETVAAFRAALDRTVERSRRRVASRAFRTTEPAWALVSGS